MWVANITRLNVANEVWEVLRHSSHDLLAVHWRAVVNTMRYLRDTGVRTSVP